MVDLHTHALFDIDDGAEFIEDSLDIIVRAKEVGIEKIALTPHFTIGNDISDFVAARDRRVDALKKAIDEKGIGIKIKAGSEVYITDEIFGEDDLSPLAIGQSRVILSEFKYNGLSAQKFLRYIDEIKSHSLIPLVAHPERYSYLKRDFSIVKAAMLRGALFQVNAASLFHDDEDGEFARFMATSLSAAVIASDVHTVHSGRLGAMRNAAEMKNEEIDKMTTYNPDMIFENSDEIYNVIEEKKRLAKN